MGREPVDPLNQCGLGSFSLTYDGSWGWAGGMCTEPHVFICKVSSEWQWGCPHSSLAPSTECAYSACRPALSPALPKRGWALSTPPANLPPQRR
jgi:hypothetical protein